MPVIESSDQKHANEGNSRRTAVRTLVISLEISIILALLIWWASSEDIRQSKSLWVLFLYSFPSQSLIAIVPHEPVFFYFSKFYSPVVVSLVALAGTLITEYFNYSIFDFFADFQPIQKAKKWGPVQRLLELFGKAPFFALWIAGLSPIPFYPFRFMAVLSGYPIHRYLLAVLTSRLPRFYIFAVIGNVFRFSDPLLIVFFTLITILIYLPLVRKAIQKRKSLHLK